MKEEDNNNLLFSNSGKRDRRIYRRYKFDLMTRIGAMKLRRMTFIKRIH